MDDGENIFARPRHACAGKAVGDYRSPRRFATVKGCGHVRQVLDCASPLALSLRVGDNHGRNTSRSLSVLVVENFNLSYCFPI